MEQFEERVIKKYKMPLLVLKVNYPGINKSNDITNNIIESLDELLSDIFSIFIGFKMLRVTSDGPVLSIAIDKEAKSIKEIAIHIEDNHTLGKCVDLDVIDTHINKISRRQLGFKKRKCFICGGNSEECIEQNKHKPDEIIHYIVNKYREYMESFHNKKE